MSSTSDPRQSVYAKYEDYPDFSYRCIKWMRDNPEGELIWKLLKYNSPDAWNMSDLTTDEKNALIYQGQEDSSLFRVFMDTGQPDAFMKECSLVRICPWAIKPDNFYYGTLLMSFEVYSHYKVNHLTNYHTRVDTIIGQLFKLFNGAEIGGIGRLFFNVVEDQNDRLIASGQVPWKGKQIFMSNKAL